MKNIKKERQILAAICVLLLLIGNTSLSMANDMESSEDIEYPESNGIFQEDTFSVEPELEDENDVDNADEITGDSNIDGQGIEESEQPDLDVETEENEVSLPSANAVAEQEASLTYSTHVADIGWQKEVTDGTMAGTTGRNLSVEAFRIKVSDSSVSGSVEYKAHVRNIGWQEWVKDGEDAGTTGRALPIEALQIRLTGELAEKYDIYYRVHAQNFGWLGWAKNEEIAGTTGWAYHVEAVEACLIEKNGPAPGATEDHYKPALWNVALSQVEDSTLVDIIPEALDQIISQSAATDISVTARLEYNGKTTHSVTAKKSVAKIKSEGFRIDFATYGKFKVDIRFEKNGKSVRNVSENAGVAAKEYNIAPLSATFPVVLFSLSAWDINVNSAGDKVPTIVMLDRPSAYNWDKLPEGVYGMPYLSESSIKSSADYTACKQYVKDLLNLSKVN